MKESPREKEAKELKEVAKVLRKMQNGSSNKAPRKAIRMPKKRFERMIASSIKLDYCEFKRRRIKEQIVINVAFEDSKEDKSKNRDSNSKVDEEIEMKNPNWGMFVEKECSEKDNTIEKSQRSMDTLEIQKVIEE